MTEGQFLRKHSNTWRQLEETINLVVKKGPQNIDFHTLKKLNRLYREASAHLSYAQTFFPESQTCLYLNDIISRCHNYIYNRKKGNVKGAIQLCVKYIPRTISANKHFIAVSFGVFLLASLFSYVFTIMDANNAYVFLPAQLIESLNIKESAARHWDNPVMSGLIMSNNIYVALKAFAYGIFLCVGTIYILLQNGLLLGSLSALAVSQGDALTYWSLILPHGIIELCAIFISGAAGLKIGYSIIRPGDYKRSSALIMAGEDALKMMGIVVPMLIIAGIIEGFFTPSSISPNGKLLFAAVTGILLFLYFLQPIGKQKKH